MIADAGAVRGTDTIISPRHSERLLAIATARSGSASASLHVLPGGHNDFPRDRTAYWAAIDEFLGR